MIKSEEYYESGQQYFQFEVIQKIGFDCDEVVDSYFKKQEDKIGIVQLGYQYYYFHYLENCRVIKSMLFAQESLNFQEDILKYCVCGKIEYFFHSQLKGEIRQLHIKTEVLKQFYFGNKYLTTIKGVKNTNFVILSWLKNETVENYIEIRDSTTLQII